MPKLPVVVKIKDVKDFVLGPHPSPELRRQYFLASRIAERVKAGNSQALLIGGCVRDALLRQQGRDLVVKDLDMEVYGLQRTELRALLMNLANDSMVKRRLGLKRIQLNEIGQQFGVFNLGGLDIALPRTESRTSPGLGRKPKVVSSSDLDFEQASRRRDLTINAMTLDLNHGLVMDARGGLEDLRHGKLRAVDRESFGDDPLRVLRVMQFTARFEFSIHPGTLSLCRSIDLKHLAKERVGQEWHKMLLWSRKPSIGLRSAYSLGILDKLHPGLAKLFKQDKRYSNSLGRALDYVASETSRFKLPENKRKLLLLTVLVHALGQRQAVSFLKQVNASGAEIKVCTSLLRLLNEMHELGSGERSNFDLKYIIKRIAFDLSCANTSLVLFDFIIALEALAVLNMKNQMIGSYTIKDFKSEAGSLRVLLKPPVAILSGRDLLALGFDPGSGMGKLLKQAVDAQFKGAFNDARGRPSKSLAIKWAESKHKLRAG